MRRTGWIRSRPRSVLMVHARLDRGGFSTVNPGLRGGFATRWPWATKFWSPSSRATEAATAGPACRIHVDEPARRIGSTRSRTGMSSHCQVVTDPPHGKTDAHTSSGGLMSVDEWRSVFSFFHATPAAQSLTEMLNGVAPHSLSRQILAMAAVGADERGPSSRTDTARPGES